MKFIKKVCKKIFNISIYLVLIVAILNSQNISYYVVTNFVYNKNATIEITKGEYSKEVDYEFVQITDDFTAKNYQHLLNIFYTILDSGVNEFSFYCDNDYKECINTINNLYATKENNVLADINNYVHPYYTYNNISITTNNFGKVTVIIQKQYTDEEIAYINEQIATISAKTSDHQTSDITKILEFHNYIVNNSEYDLERANNMENYQNDDSKSHTAYGLLIEKKALCGGYSDIMSIYIHTLGINNIRISGNNHVWNLVNIDGWKHLDATWDDPVTSTGEDILLYDYFLITTEELKAADEFEHNFNPEVYAEAK